VCSQDEKGFTRMSEKELNPVEAPKKKTRAKVQITYPPEDLKNEFRAIVREEISRANANLYKV
jgi:hypothetical protein